MRPIIDLGFNYKGVMCFNDGKAYVLCDSNLWPIGRVQVSLPKKLHSIYRMIGFDEDGNETEFTFNRFMNDYDTHKVIEAYNKGKLAKMISDAFPRTITYPKWYTPRQNIAEINQLAKEELKNNPINDYQVSRTRKRIFKEYHGILKYLRKNTKAYTLNGELIVSAGSLYLPDGAVEYSLPDVMADVNKLVCRISNREFEYTLNAYERSMKTNDFMYNQLPIIFSTFDIAGDKISIESLDERDFLAENIADFAEMLKLELPEETIKFKWSTIGDKIVARKVRATYTGRVPKLEYGKIISNKNMADTLQALNLIDSQTRQSENDHIWGTIFEALIYIANKQKAYDTIDKLIKKLVRTGKGW
jgi:hypothetical protein